MSAKLSALAGIGPTPYAQLRLAQQDLGSPACYQVEYLCVLDWAYLMTVWSWVLMVRETRG